MPGAVICISDTLILKIISTDCYKLIHRIISLITEYSGSFLNKK